MRDIFCTSGITTLIIILHLLKMFIEWYNSEGTNSALLNLPTKKSPIILIVQLQFFYQPYMY
jgi:hypothetical protein